jgi:peroxiredoxin
MPQSSRIKTALCALAIGFLASASAQAKAPAIGAAAPDFTLRSSFGKNLKLSEYRGQVVMINFWATWCAPCRQELPQLNRLHERYQRDGFVLLGVSVDDNPKAAQEMVNRLGVRFPVLFDAAKQVSDRYDIDAMPSTLLIDRSGAVRYLHRGYRSGVEREYDARVRELLKQ